MGIYLGKTLLGKVNLAGKTVNRKVFLLSAVKARTGTVTLRVLTTGKPVQIDGLLLIKS